MCADLLEVVVDHVQPHLPELKRMWLERRCSYAPLDASGVWRFREFLPSCYSDVVTMAEGNNPLVTRPENRAMVRLCAIFSFKHLGWNPTACFKDLGMTVGMTEAVYIGAKSVACASTGNTSGSLAAYAARAGLTAKVYLACGTGLAKQAGAGPRLWSGSSAGGRQLRLGA